MSILRTHPTPTPPQVPPPSKQHPLLATREDHQEPVTNCPEGPCFPGPQSVPQPQFCPLQGPCDTPPGPQLLGPGFYRLQLGPFVADGAPGAPEHEHGHGTPRGLQVGFSLPSPAPASPAVAPTLEFGALSSFLRPPVQHSHSLTQ